MSPLRLLVLWPAEGEDDFGNGLAVCTAWSEGEFLDELEASQIEWEAHRHAERPFWLGARH